MYIYYIKLILERKSRPGSDSGDLIRWVEDLAGSEGVGRTSVGHALTRVVHCKTHSDISSKSYFFFNIVQKAEIILYSVCYYEIPERPHK